jgi:hypothetical protein
VYVVLGLAFYGIIFTSSVYVYGAMFLEKAIIQISTLDNLPKKRDSHNRLVLTPMGGT